MNALRLDVSKQAPIARGGMDTAFTRRALGKREARRLAEIMPDAEERVRAIFEAAKHEAEDIFAHAAAEVEAMLAKLPDFAAIDAAGKSAMRAIRQTADRHGVSMGVVVGRIDQDNAERIRGEGVSAVARACPKLSDAQIASLFDGVSEAMVRWCRDGGTA